jgi:hypothetical protein
MVRRRNSALRLLLPTALVVLAGCGDQQTSEDENAGENPETPIRIEWVADLDDEAAPILRPLADSAAASSSAPLAFLRGDTLFADVLPALAVIDPTAVVEQRDGRLWLYGTDTGLPAEARDGRSYAPVIALAQRFGAFVRLDGAAQMATLWGPELLCRYAKNANYAAAVFIEAAEQGLLRRCTPPIDTEIRRWESARDDEQWAAAVTLRDSLDTRAASALLAEIGAAPYAAYGAVVGHPLVVREPNYRTSPNVIARLDREAVSALERTLCGLPGALDRRGRAPAVTDSPATSGSSGAPRRAAVQTPARDAHGEKQMLTSVLAARAALPGVKAGAPVVRGFEVLARAGDLKRLASDPRVRAFEPAIRVGEDWVTEGPVLAVSGPLVPVEIERMDAAALAARLEDEAARSGTDCRP